MNELLSVINMNMYNVTTMAPDWATLNAVNTARHILTGSTITLTTEQKCKLNRNLIKGWVCDVCVRRSMETLAEEPAVMEMKTRLEDYEELLRCTRQTDYQISSGGVVKKQTALDLLWSVLLFCVEGVLALPGILLSLPGLVVVSVYSHHYQSNALKKSSVKISAMDVLATGKVISAALCFIICVLLEPALMLLVAAHKGFEVTFMDYMGIACVLPWLFYLTVFLGSGHGAAG